MRPPKFRTRMVARASADLNEIIEYIEFQSPQNASLVANRLADAIDSLEYLPRRFKVYRSSRDPARVIHSMSVPPFIVYYRVIDDQLVVEVQTIRRGTRRQPRRF